MTRKDIALQIFTALLTRKDSTLDLYPELGEKQIRTCFLLADVFERVAWETASHPEATDLRETKTKQ